MRGLVNRLLDHSFVDGPGNRAVVFLQGCMLRCLYCHNPQTQALCEGCEACVPDCPGSALSPAPEGGALLWDQELCQGCDHCISVCPTAADPRSRSYAVDELAEWLRPMAPFLSGLTVSGGDPLMQPEFTAALCREAKALGLSTMIETSSAVDWSVFEQVLPWLDGALVDIKVWDEALHRKLTGVSGLPVKENLRRLAELGKLVEAKLPIIPGFSDTPENVAAAASFLAGLNPEIPVKLLRFRAHGTTGPARDWPSPTDELLNELVAVAREAGLRKVTRSR